MTATVDLENLAEYFTRARLLGAHDRIRTYIHRTPVLTSGHIDHAVGAQLFFKCENFQKVGAFKARGAFNAVMSLSDAKAKKGVVTHSSGNHAAALSLSAKTRGIPAYVVMPKTAPEVKKIAVRSYGAIITECEPLNSERERVANEVIQQTGATFIHPFDNSDVILGQGTAGIELFEDTKGIDIYMCPVGGGGLLSGLALAAHHFHPGAKVIAAEPESADDAYRGFVSGVLQTQESPKTIADGLLTPLSLLTFSIIRRHVNEIVTCSEESIIQAMELIWQYMKIIVEPSSAVPLACILESKEKFAGRRIAIVLTGGNVDLRKLPWNS